MTSTYSATYDAWNRLVEIKDGANVVARFEYDGLNRRVKSHLDTDETAGVDTYRHFFYNSGWQIVETRETATEAAHPESLDVEMQYVWSRRYIDAPVLRDRDAGAGGDLGVTDSGLEERLYYTTDANMNVTALLDTGGDAVERYVYDPYGNCTVYDDDWSDEVSWANSKQNHIRYCGYYFDNETGLCHVRHRPYHPTLGRWLQRDPIGYVDGTGLYAYARGSPGRYVDPSGGAAIPTPGAPVGGHKLGVVPDQNHKNPGLAQSMADAMRDLCPCFSYDVSDGPQTRHGSTSIITITGNPEYKDKIRFCCCYYEHLPGCNLLYQLATRGLTSGSYGGTIPVGYGAQVPSGALGLRMRGSTETVGEEVAHAVYGLEEDAANHAKDLAAGTGETKDLTSGNVDKRHRQTGSAGFRGHET